MMLCSKMYLKMRSTALIFLSLSLNLRNLSFLIGIRSYIDSEGKERHIDLLFSVRMKDSKEEVKILFLLEHKSQKYDLIFEQLLNYQTIIYKKKKYEYPILPIVFYHGKNKEWRGPLNFQDFIKNFDPILRRYFSRFILNFEPKILNVRKIDLFN